MARRTTGRTAKRPTRKPARATPRATARATGRATATPTAADPLKPPVALVNVAADASPPDGFRDFRIRDDLAASYRAVLARVHALGGVITSSGALRDLHEPATPGRSRTSLHYTGRAIDLHIESGARRATNPYLVTASTAGTTPVWTIFCESRTPKPEDALFDASLITEGTLECVIWKKGIGITTIQRTARYFSLTQLFLDQGWKPISARSDWKTNYLSCEWWHFQNETGLKLGVSRFGDELLKIWPRALVEASGLAVDAVWVGRSFQVRAGGAAPAVPSAAAPPTADKIRFVQMALNTLNREALDVDGNMGRLTRAAIVRFQEQHGLPPTGLVDAATESAIHNAVQPAARV
jgi:hypothetical protein